MHPAFATFSPFQQQVFFAFNRALTAEAEIASGNPPEGSFPLEMRIVQTPPETQLALSLSVRLLLQTIETEMTYAQIRQQFLSLQTPLEFKVNSSRLNADNTYAQDVYWLPYLTEVCFKEGTGRVALKADRVLLSSALSHWGLLAQLPKPVPPVPPRAATPLPTNGQPQQTPTPTINRPQPATAQNRLRATPQLRVPSLAGSDPAPCPSLPTDALPADQQPPLGPDVLHHIREGLESRRQPVDEFPHDQRLVLYQQITTLLRQYESDDPEDTAYLDALLVKVLESDRPTMTTILECCQAALHATNPRLDLLYKLSARNIHVEITPRTAPVRPQSGIRDLLLPWLQQSASYEETDQSDTTISFGNAPAYQALAS